MMRSNAMLEKGRLEKKNFAGAWKSAEGNCHFKSISSTIRLRKSSATIRLRNLREIAFPRILVYTYKCIDTFVVLMSTQSKLARPNVLGLPCGVRTLKSLSLEMWCRSRIHAIHIIPIFAQHRMKENPGK